MNNMIVGEELHKQKAIKDKEQALIEVNELGQ
jgi:hypothetical protein